MEQQTHPDPAWQRTRDAFQHLTQTLIDALPAPPGETAEARARRNNAIIAQVSALCPANAAEAGLAVQHVAANAMGLAAMRMAASPDLAPGLAVKCLAQVNATIRLAQSALRALQRMQAAREKREAQENGAGATAWAEHIAARTMSEDIASAPEQVGPSLDPEVETYIHVHPRRAALIRRHGGVPDDVSFGPPDETIVHALVTGRSPLLLTLDNPEF